MTFDTSISAGNLITILIGVVVWVITLTVAWTKFGGRMDMIEFRVLRVEETLERIATVLEKFSNSEKDMALMKRDVSALQLDFATLNATVEGLRKGEGFIQAPRRANVDGEYLRP